MPDVSEYRRDDREERQHTLQKRPKHKEVATIDEKLMSAALTMEDKGQFINLPLINTLRDNSHAKYGNKSETKKVGSGEDEEGKEDAGPDKPPETIPMPPSFYNDAVDKWQKKYERVIKDRD